MSRYKHSVSLKKIYNPKLPLPDRILISNINTILKNEAIEYKYLFYKIYKSLIQETTFKDGNQVISKFSYIVNF